MKVGKIRLGNWVVTKYYKKGVPFIQIKPVSGEFAWEYSSLDKKFIEIESAIDNETSCEALKECFAIDAELLHNETGIFHLVYMKSMDLLYHLGSHRNIKTEENVSNAILEAFNAAKDRIDELYGGRIDHSIVTDADNEAIKEMRITDELAEELKNIDFENGSSNKE